MKNVMLCIWPKNGQLTQCYLKLYHCLTTSLPTITCLLAHLFYKEHKERAILCNVQLCFSKALYNTQQHHHDICKISWHQTSNLASNCGYTKQVALMQKIQSHHRQLLYSQKNNTRKCVKNFKICNSL